jgi:hypothetical protein
MDGGLAGRAALGVGSGGVGGRRRRLGGAGREDGAQDESKRSVKA